MGNIDNTDKINDLISQVNQGVNDFSGNMGQLYVEMSNYLSLVKAVNESISQNVAQSLSQDIMQSINVSGKNAVININNSASNSNVSGGKGEEKKEEPKKSEPTKKDAIDRGKKLLEEAKKVTSDAMDCFEGLDETTKGIVSSSFDIGAAALTGISSVMGLATSSSSGITATSSSAAGAMKSLESASAILQIISAAIAITKALLQICDADNERVIKKNQDSINKLKREYKELGEEIGKAYGYDKSAKIEEQNANLIKQKELVEEQRKAEETKKKTDKQKLNDYDNQLTDLNIQIEKNKDAAIDAVFGSSLSSAINDFATAYLEVWDSADGKVKAQKDVVKDMIKGIVKELVKDGIADKVKALRERIAEAMKSEGIDAAEDADIQAQAKEITEQMDRDTAMLGKYLKEDDPEREATKRGFGAITQESADELNGRFTSIQYNTEEITNSIKTLLINSDSVLKCLLGIQDNTSHCTRLEAIEKDMSAVKTGIGIMTTKGVRMI